MQRMRETRIFFFKYKIIFLAVGCVLTILLLALLYGNTRNSVVSTGMAANKNILPVYETKQTEKAQTETKMPVVQSPQEVLVAIDAGHGGDEWGTYYGDIIEKNVNLDISIRMGDLLTDEGIKILYTHKTDVFVDLKPRAAIANNADATLFISVHNNMMPNAPGYKGTETLYSSTFNRTYSKMSDEKLARIVQKELVNAMGTINNGIIYRPGLAVLHRTNMPAVIAEVGYISNEDDRDKLSQKNYRQKAAVALSQAVQKALIEMGAKKNSKGRWMITKG